MFFDELDRNERIQLFQQRREHKVERGLSDSYAEDSRIERSLKAPRLHIRKLAYSTGGLTPEIIENLKNEI